MTRNRAVHGAILCVENGAGTLSWTGASGNLEPRARYFIASVTKMYVTVVVLRLRAENRIDLDAPMSRYLPEELIAGLHVTDGVDRTAEITVRHLISNTSGLTDYFFGKGPDGRKAAVGLFDGHDEAWPVERIVERVRTLKPRFRPGQPGKVHYSDTNYELLGSIIESVTGKPIAEVFREYIFDDLGLRDTYAFADPEDTTPAPMYYKEKPVHVPRYIASITAEGGLVSTAPEVMKFLKAFFAGHFFPKETIEELKAWNRIYFPGQFDFGIGLEKQWVPRIMSPLKPIGELLGFWGQSGAFAFHNPGHDLYFTGTVNQLSGFGHGSAVKAMLQVIKAVKPKAR
ncbi:MAG: class A beta-lactamase-related serine hydrolase [Spirochaetaceae bacterium]|nr:MAG: class A beta-lactamase-related serine hydrolase [Spirochaetaceae bacterium]